MSQHTETPFERGMWQMRAFRYALERRQNLIRVPSNCGIPFRDLKRVAVDTGCYEAHEAPRADGRHTSGSNHFFRLIPSAPT